MNALGRDIGSQIEVDFAADQFTVTAGGGNDGAFQTGQEIILTDRNNRAQSVAFVAAVKATLGASETATLAMQVQTREGSSGSWTELEAEETVLTLTGGAGGTTERGAGKKNVNLARKAVKDRIRVRLKLTMSAGATDTGEVAPQAVFGGLDTP